MNLTDADKLGYDADRMARTWEVRSKYNVHAYYYTVVCTILDI